MRALEICEEVGILLCATYVGNPNATKEEFDSQLMSLSGLPLADADIRLAMALRNTPYFHRIRKHLILDPDKDSAYFDRQNYRYQTISFPGMITPEETYDSVRAFKKGFLRTKSHIDYVKSMLSRHPDTGPFFLRQYKAASKKELVSMLRPISRESA